MRRTRAESCSGHIAAALLLLLALVSFSPAGQYASAFAPPDRTAVASGSTSPHADDGRPGTRLLGAGQERAHERPVPSDRYGTAGCPASARAANFAVAVPSGVLLPTPSIRSVGERDRAPPSHSGN